MDTPCGLQWNFSKQLRNRTLAAELQSLNDWDAIVNLGNLSYEPPIKPFHHPAAANAMLFGTDAGLEWDPTMAVLYMFGNVLLGVRKTDRMVLLQIRGRYEGKKAFASYGEVYEPAPCADTFPNTTETIEIPTWHGFFVDTALPRGQEPRPRTLTSAAQWGDKVLITGGCSTPPPHLVDFSCLGNTGIGDGLAGVYLLSSLVVFDLNMWTWETELVFDYSRKISSHASLVVTDPQTQRG